MMSPGERRAVARKIEDYYRQTHGWRGGMVTPRPPLKAVPLALKFDVSLTEGDKLRLRALGVEA
jgi:hypothetical protein